MKVFEIGKMKTGTTSLGRAFEILGYKHKGWSLKIYNQFLESDKKDYKILYEVIDNYDTFVDAPWRSCDYKILDKKYPNSKFILLERDGESWIRSMEHWSSPELNKDWETWPTEFDRSGIDKRWVGDRDNLIKEKLDSKKLHYSERKKYFKDRPNDLLVMNICDDEGWGVLCPFLNKPIPNVSFPKENISENYE